MEGPQSDSNKSERCAMMKFFICFYLITDVEPKYAGARIEGDVVTLEFVKKMMDDFKNQKMLHKRLFRIMNLHWKKFTFRFYPGMKMGEIFSLFETKSIEGLVLASTDGVKLSDIRAIDWFCEPPEEGLMCEILWSGPQPNPVRGPSKRNKTASEG
ncbi:putative protein-serine/threonine phosphatase [Helianthus annuus]|uniref:protein-serine/threonine phosphatase n=1 Tax=Helianthus annuus TaxID=4232 RepID=A0A9K3P6B5_HELAN|nr:putative protein-serine/threonine phosphatase [Helianthus annuus]KAJ0495607.1 putative protein-serine/threonine phosphatase [Helianthus annuus]KAJ0606306.1 putative protein-serine/threonine phosphatase [Helianthus annuus]KAJ0766400.1 putative protein-serine/threonine phosphatase [Helianthus annuus]KAJ0933587.1 putative protein-serine/threonine phosphatase [Helianthus annuus]